MTITYLGSTEPDLGPVTNQAFSPNSARTLSLPNASGGFTAELWGVTPGQIKYYGTEPTTYTVKYIVDGIVVDEVSVLADSLLAKPQDPVKNGYTFDGWFMTNGEWNFATDVVIGDIMLFAKWTQVIYGCTDRFSENYNPNATVNDGSCTYKKIEEPITGCMDTEALNYNPVATVSDDNSCIYPSATPQVIYGCTDPKSLNYNPNATDFDGSCVYAEEENIFNAETAGTPVDTVGTRPIENCALSINVAIIDVSISKVDVLTSHEVKVYWVIELEGGITILYSANYEVSQSGVTLFYLSIICKEGTRAGQLRSAEAGVTGFTVSATYDVDLGATGICQPKEANGWVVVYPNPFTDKLTILVKDAKADIALYSIDGKPLANYSNQTEVHIATGQLPAGVYIVKVTANGKTENVTVVKR
jgi:uncharacterized repeat protein (TIGR02543 family)